MENQDLYYIDRVNTWSPANQKCKELLGMALELRESLFVGAAAVNDAVAWLKEVVTELNVRYPRTKKLVVGRKDNYVFCQPEERRLEDELVFSFHIVRVRKVSEPSAPPQPSPNGEGVKKIRCSTIWSVGRRVRARRQTRIH